MNYFPVKIINRLLAHKDKIILGAILWSAFVLYLCVMPKSRVPKIQIKNLDKFAHLCLHFGITFLWFLYFKITKNNTFKVSSIKAFGFSLIFGIVIEIWQSFLTTTRSADFIDVLANTIGALFAILFFYTLKKKNGIPRKNRTNFYQP